MEIGALHYNAVPLRLHRLLGGGRFGIACCVRRPVNRKLRAASLDLVDDVLWFVTFATITKDFRDQYLRKQ